MQQAGEVFRQIRDTIMPENSFTRDHPSSTHMLPIEYQNIYKEFYKEYASSATTARKVAQIFESWYHHKVSKWQREKSVSILEIGCGSLSHMKYESRYHTYDVVEPKQFLLKNSRPSDLARVTNIYESLDTIPVNKRYTKIISIACLEHIKDLECHLSLVKERLEANGSFIVAIPAEGELLWWLGWRLTTGIGFWLKYKLDYGVIMRFEHVNSAQQVMKELKKQFSISKERSYPFNLKNLRLYIALECKLPI
jgi:hypothetical protein